MARAAMAAFGRPVEISIERRRGGRLALAQPGDGRVTAIGDKGLTLLVEAAGTAADAPVVAQRSDVEGLELAALVGAVGALEERVDRLALGGTVVGGVLRHG
jgi:hypothetical protein